ncbi:hypothetical protein BKA66DRAFT_146951 [Pyrenochaeta sp. MPI-SDFR-AT-0127]|nr:hypothetical protein BKA66DRAFT_146951 [Pyrenochaeta sp. MPI-SDFR-AT-0127]
MTTRRSQRQSLSCLNCTRQKIRCSKAIPCTSCIDRGQEASCRRERVEVTSKRIKMRTKNTESAGASDRGQVDSSVRAAKNPPVEYGQPSLSGTQLESSRNFSLPVPPLVPHIHNDTMITLEFLSHGRQSILRIGDSDPQKRATMAATPTRLDIMEEHNSWDLIVTIDQAQSLLSLHQDALAWMHNVVHMPTFCKEFQMYKSAMPCDRSWLSLYYALICTTVYHADDVDLLSMGLPDTNALVQALYNRSIQSLHEANFMAVHTLRSVQTICVLLQVAYNLDQSDLISVLLSAAIRTSQSLELHRLGPDQELNSRPTNTSTDQYLIDREVKKRTWWFLVRQDWLQIPFQNTFIIHASQFNTPMPLNCYDDEIRMISDGKIAVQPYTTYTQTSYSNELHKVAIVIWKHQNRTCTAGHPGDSHEGIMRLYDQTLWADSELKQKYRAMPSFFQSSWTSSEIPGYPNQLCSIQLLSTAHKIHTVHRYFQLQSFRDKAFAYTQQSCVAISQQCIKDIETWPSNSAARMALKMWTVLTHVITCCINLTFASMFRNENILLYDGAEMQRLAKVGRETIRPAEEWSSIARRGGALLDALFEIESSLFVSTHAQFNIEDIIKRVRQVDDAFQGNLSLAPELADSFFDFNADWAFS